MTTVIFTAAGLTTYTAPVANLTYAAVLGSGGGGYVSNAAGGGGGWASATGTIPVTDYLHRLNITLSANSYTTIYQYGSIYHLKGYGGRSGYFGGYGGTGQSYNFGGTYVTPRSGGKGGSSFIAATVSGGGGGGAGSKNGVGGAGENGAVGGSTGLGGAGDTASLASIGGKAGSHTAAATAGGAGVSMGTVGAGGGGGGGGTLSPNGAAGGGYGGGGGGGIGTLGGAGGAGFQGVAIIKFGGAVTVNTGWFKPWTDPDFRKKFPSAEQSSHTAPTQLITTSIGWFNELSRPKPVQFALKEYDYTGPTQLLTTAIAWYESLSEPQRDKLGLKARLQRFYESGTFLNPAPEIILLNWYKQFTDPFFSKTYPTSEQTSSTGPTQIITPSLGWYEELSRVLPRKVPSNEQNYTGPSQIITPSTGWYTQFTDPYLKKSFPTSEQPTFIGPTQVIIPSISWYESLSEPKKLRGTQFDYQLITPETFLQQIGWLEALSEPSRKQGPTYGQQFIVPESTLVELGWLKQLSELDKKVKSSYYLLQEVFVPSDHPGPPGTGDARQTRFIVNLGRFMNRGGM